MLLVLIFLWSACIDLARPDYIVYNASSICLSPQQPCFFNDPAIWIGGQAPGSDDDVMIRAVGVKSRRMEVFINSTVYVRSVTMSNNVMLTVRQFGFLNTTTISWRGPSTIQVDAGRLRAVRGVWSDEGENVNNGSLIVKNAGRFVLSESTQVGNATISNGSLVQMLNLKVLDTMNVTGSRLSTRFIDVMNLFSFESNVITTISLFVGNYARFSGSLVTEYLSSFSATQIVFINATASVADLEVGTLSITSSNLTLTPSHPLVSLHVTNSTVTFVNTDDSSDELDDELPPAHATILRDTTNNTVAFANVLLANASISLTNNINMCNLQIQSNSTIYGNLQVTCGISFNSSLIVNGNYTQSANTSMNISTSYNFSANYTFLRVYGGITILGAAVYKDTSAPGINGTLRLAMSLPGRLKAKVEVAYDPYLVTGMVDVITVDAVKGHILLVPTKIKGPKQSFFYEDWRYIIAAVLVTLLAVGTFALAKYMRRTKELDERLLLQDDDHGGDSDEEGDEDEEEVDGMGDRRLSFKIE